MTLTEFLLARIAEDLQRADCYPDAPVRDEVLAARAKRMLMDIHEDACWSADPEDEESEAEGCYECDARPCLVRRMVGLFYASHPDYQEEWKI